MEQNEPKKTKKTTAKTDTDMKKTGSAKSTEGPNWSIQPTQPRVRAPRTEKAKTVTIGR
ncbi:hypothetical protein PI125_g22503 [Phytophthora idaei]|nr:hypothetical protein PI125_g22503 [Phytophthora idaei]